MKGKSVFITGGSSGLGFILARRFLEQGSEVAICGRSVPKLERAARLLRERTGRGVLAVACDVGKPESVEWAVSRILEARGRVDVLVNNAGIIQVGPAQDWSLGDFDDAMDANFKGTLHCTYALLPHMRARRRGTIVNITSIGGEVAVPGLLPYVCAKFAAVGFSLGSAAELARDGIRVVTIAPGLMRTGSFVNVDFRTRPRRAYASFRTAASLPLVTMGAERAAAKIVRATRNGRTHVVLGAPFKAARIAYQLLPGTFTRVFSVVNRALLPRPAGRPSRSARGSRLLSGRSRPVSRYQPTHRGRPAS